MLEENQIVHTVVNKEWNHGYNPQHFRIQLQLLPREDAILEVDPSAQWSCPSGHSELWNLSYRLVSNKLKKKKYEPTYM